MQTKQIAKLFAFVAAVALATCALAACANSPGASSSSASGSSSTASSSASASTSSSSASSFSPVSIVRFEGIGNADKLVADMEAGVTPVSSTVCYDQMGSLPTVTVTDPEKITDIYNRLAGITVNGPSNESITDCYHFIGFELQDGTKVSFSFEGEGLLSLSRENYSVSGGGELWKLVRSIQDEYMEAEGISAS